jgi:hypothetical protein
MRPGCPLRNAVALGHRRCSHKSMANPSAERPADNQMAPSGCGTREPGSMGHELSWYAAHIESCPISALM